MNKTAVEINDTCFEYLEMLEKKPLFVMLFLISGFTKFSIFLSALRRTNYLSSSTSSLNGFLLKEKMARTSTTYLY